jgi:N-acetylmuramoyl-L-alanine amidase
VDKLQNSHRSDLFVSIHVNSAQKKSVSGVETYCLTPVGVVSGNSKQMKKESDPGNRFDPSNMAVAYFIQRNLIFRTGAVDRGVKRANFAVLRNLNAPGVLIEIGFISNEKEERLLNSPGYLARLALGIVGGIAEYQRAVR